MKILSKTSLLLLLAGLFFACAKDMNPDIERGSDINREEGYTGFRLSTHGFLNLSDVSALSVTTEIIYGALDFQDISESKEIRSARFNIAIMLQNRETGKVINANQDFEITSDLDDFLIRNKIFKYTEEFEVAPGEYNVAVSVFDLQSGLEVIRRTEAYVPDFHNSITDFTSVQMSGKGDSFTEPGFYAITEYNLSSALDSLRFSFQVSNNNTERPLIIRSRMIRFDADLLPATPMSYSNPTPSQIMYKGINYRDYAVLDERVRTLEQPGNILIEFKYGLPERGNYRFEINTTDEDGNRHFRARDFAVRSENFPAIISSREMAMPLVYLMSGSEYAGLMALDDPIDIKKYIDHFWLSNVGSMERARRVINMYYERVEEANKLYTNFKEGWKTDRGKMHILFGMPWHIDRKRNELVWSYTHNFDDPQYNYLFQRKRIPDEFFPFDHYLLNRATSYHSVEYRQQQLFRTGSILDRSK